MMSKQKRLILVLVLIFIFSILAFLGIIDVMQRKHVNSPADPGEEFFDNEIEIFINSSPNLEKKILLESEEIAMQYAKILYLENFGEWGDEFVLWVKHYKKYGVWLAKLRASEPFLDGPPTIIFKDTDGQVIWYGR